MKKIRMDIQNFFTREENTVTQHILFWTFFLLAFVTFEEYPNWLKGIEIVCFMFQFVAFIAIPGYLHNWLVLPFFKKKEVVQGTILYTIELTVLILALPYIFEGIASIFVLLFDMKQQVPWRNEKIGFNVFGFTAMASIINIARERFVLQREKREAELRQLKEQLNPHFLFNTLNNLYGLSVVKSDKLPGLMLKLSDLLRYSLYETKDVLVPLDKEISYIKNFIDLEKLRLEERTNVSVSTSGDFEKYTIAPLMLILFIENSFKHHSSKRNEKGFITIDMEVSEGVFLMRVHNSVDATFIASTELKTVGGIGLTNVKKRLNLIYGSKYSLNIDHKPNSYLVELELNLI